MKNNTNDDVCCSCLHCAALRHSECNNSIVDVVVVLLHMFICGLQTNFKGAYRHILCVNAANVPLYIDIYCASLVCTA